MIHIGEKMASHLSASTNSESSTKETLTQEENITPPELPERAPISNEVSIQEYFQNQKTKFQKLYEKFIEEGKSGDAVYIFPKTWFISYFKTDTIDKDNESFSNEQALKLYFKAPQLPQYIDQSNYLTYIESDVLMPMGFDLMTEIFNFYGFEGKFIEGFIIKNEDGISIDGNLLNMQVCLLVENRWKVSQSVPVFFTSSKYSNLSQLFQTAANKLQDIVSLDSFDKRCWYSSFDISVDENPVNDFLMLPNDFLKLEDIQFVDSTMADMHIPEQNYFKLNTLIIEIRFGDVWPSLCHLYNSTKNNINNSQEANAPHQGLIGLNNLGNTCFMNSALQCLAHIPELVDYFVYGCHKEELNLNNPLGYNGKIAVAFGDLIQDLYEKNTDKRSKAPRNFKMTLGMCNQMFAGYSQQDSQEFLTFLLDGLHEDLNRIKEKPYVENPSSGLNFDVNDKEKLLALAKETWEKYKLRNDSIVLDLFVGLYQSTLKCPDCKNVSVTFDPFNDLSLPIPIESFWRKNIYILPLNDDPHTLELEMHDNLKYNDLKKEVARYMQVEPEHLVGFEFYSSSIYKCFENESSGSVFLPLEDLITSHDIPFFVEVGPYDPEKDLIIPLYNSTDSSEGPKRFNQMANENLCGYPTLIKFEKSRLGDFQYIMDTICKSIKNSTTIDPLTIPTEDQELLSKRFDEVVDDLKTSKKLSDDVYNEMKCLKDTWINYKVMSNWFDIAFLTNVSSLSFKDNMSSQETTEKIAIPEGKMDLSRAISLVDAHGDLFKELFEQAVSANKDSDLEDEVTDENSTDNVELQAGDDVENVDQNNEVTDWSPQESLFTKLTQKAGIFVIQWKMSREEQESFYKTPKIYTNTDLEEKNKTALENETNSKTITLDDCLKRFTETETLSQENTWYCSVCQDHKQADKKIQIWELPDILCIHLKRFKNHSMTSDKIDELVEFPISEFDLTSQIGYPKNDEKYIYDLIAVDNHYGGIGGGHYTAYAKNFSDGKWYYYNDSKVTEAQEEQSISSAAYLLFYKRRGSDNDENHEKLKELVNKKREENEKFEKFLDEKQKAVAIILENHGVSIVDESDDSESDSSEANVHVNPEEREIDEIDEIEEID